MDVRRFLAYSDALSARWWDDLAKLPPDALAKTVDFSFLTPVGILTHMANVENAWVDVIERKEPQWARHSTKTWTELAPVRAYAQEARARTHAVVDALSDADLASMRGPVKGNFARDTLSVEEVLFTICTHEQIHRGELLAALWVQNVTPPVSDYPAYLTPLR
jgi:uncharacterized damage-inducible protein DinB